MLTFYNAELYARKFHLEADEILIISWHYALANKIGWKDVTKKQRGEFKIWLKERHFEIEKYVI